MEAQVSPLQVEEDFYNFKNMHTVSITDYKQLNNGQFAVGAICCGDESTKSFHTMLTPVFTDPTQLQQSLNWFYNRMATEHEAMIQSKVVAANLIGSKTTVDLSQTTVPSVPAAQAATVQ